MNIERSVLYISEFGIKIKNIKAGMLYDVNLGTRDYFTYTDAMLNNSLFSFYLQKNGLNVYRGKKNIENSKNESTRDIVCLDFDFGSRSYDEEIKRLYNLFDNDKLTDESKERISNSIEKVKSREHLYSEKKRGEIRNKFYNEGVDITYKTKGKDGSVKSEQTIHYKMLFRTSAKAKLGQVIFINEELYEKAYDWLTIGLGKKMAHDNAKIVEMSAYAPLTTSTIVGTIHIPVEDILILKDQESFFKTIVNIVKAEEYTVKEKNKETKKIETITKKKCIVTKGEDEVKNTIWDGMGIIESDILPEWVNGMALMRNHLFKMCGVRVYIQKFFKDWCEENNYNYESYQVQDMFGNWHYLKDIKMITTDNAIKWKKFVDIMGGTLESAYSYWCNRIHADGDIWGIVKTDHKSKLGEYQQLSYQMVNTLPCSKEDVKKIAQTSISYVESLKSNNDEFEKFLRKNSNEINHYEMLADLYERNHDFANCKWFREEKRKIISAYVSHLRKGKIFVNGDNLTVFGNPYALLLYSVGDDWQKDTTLVQELNPDGTSVAIQCYTNRFADGEYLAAFRNPHNSPNNICYMHNVYSKELQKYFKFSTNIVAINCIKTDIQDRANGMDEDSDFMLFTNQETIVRCAKECYSNYPTIVNKLKESGVTYTNTMDDYSKMDNRFSGSQMGIGWSSNLAQLAMTYYWTEKAKENCDKQKLDELYDIFIILSVLAQVIIDGCKREYEIDGEKEIKRISKLPCMTMQKQIIDKNGKPKKVKYDFPEFMKYTKEIKTTKNGKELSCEIINEARNKIKNRINPELQCPMNWLEEWLDKIQNISSVNSESVEKYFVKMNGKANDRQMSKIRSIIEEYDSSVKYARINQDEDTFNEFLIEKSNSVMQELSKIKIGNIVTINRLIEIALGLEKNNNNPKCYKSAQKYTRKMLNCLYKMNKEKFLINFV